MSGVCLVTGGARGIGRSTALLLASRGWAVAVGFQSHQDEAKAVVKLADRMSGRAVAIQGDVSVESDVIRLFDESEQALGKLTAVVNSAGISVKGAIADLEAEDLSRLLSINVVGLMLCCREAVRRMSLSAGGSGGSIVNVSSMAATIGGRPTDSAYAASKGAVDVFTTGLAKEVASEGIRANVVRPGMTITDMTTRFQDDPIYRASIEASIPMRRAGRPEEVAEAIVWLLSDEASFVSGAHLNVGGGGFLIS